LCVTKGNKGKCEQGELTKIRRRSTPVTKIKKKGSVFLEGGCKQGLVLGENLRTLNCKKKRGVMAFQTWDENPTTNQGGERPWMVLATSFKVVFRGGGVKRTKVEKKIVSGGSPKTATKKKKKNLCKKNTPR